MNLRQGVRMPLAYSPPATPGGGSSGGGGLVTDDIEVIPISFSTWADVNRIGSFSKPWKACDVYVQPSPGSATVSGVLSIFIWAVSGGVRVLVASGRVLVRPVSTMATAITLPEPVYAAAARGGAATFEVTGRWNQLAALGVQPGGLTVSLVGSNVDSPPEADVGAIPMSLGEGVGTFLSGGTLGSQAPGGYALDALKLIGVQAMNGAASPRWLHLHDVPLANAPTFNGETPIFCWPMGAAIGSGIVDRAIRYRCRQKMILVPSSTMLTTTNVVDCAIQAWVQ